MSERAATRRPLVRSIGVGIGAGVLLGLVAAAVVALPLLAVAQVEPGQGLDRSLVQTGMRTVVVPVAVVVAVVAGVVTGSWYRRGRRAPWEQSGPAAG